jgi:hypothetical protein
LGECLNDCPEGYTPNYELNECLSLESLDVSYVYFPVSQAALCLFILSCVGKWVKPRHNILSNFVIMMSMLEHLSILAQVCFAFAYGNIVWGVIFAIVELLFCVIQFLYWKDFKNEVINKDITYQKWLAAKSNKWTKKIVSGLGTLISWRFYKLLYSHYFGYQIKNTDFSDNKKYQLIMLKYTKLTMMAIYAPIIILNFICLFTILWGNQLYI